MNNFCKEATDVQCTVSNILNRIEPIRYENEMLIINSDVSTNSSVVLINNQPILVENGVLDFTANSTIDQQPLNGLPFTGDTLELPPLTTINNFKLLTTNYFYFMNNGKQTSGSYIVNAGGAPVLNPTYNFNGINFPFIAPQDCVLTSFLFSFVGNKGGVISETITNINAYLDMIDPSGTITYTGISVNIPSCLPNRKPFADKQFTYPLSKGNAIGVRFTYNGNITTTYGGWQFATLGYRFVL